jgi:hypothetical protein
VDGEEKARVLIVMTIGTVVITIASLIFAYNLNWQATTTTRHIGGTRDYTLYETRTTDKITIFSIEDATGKSVIVSETPNGKPVGD